MTTAIIIAGGSGKRMGESIPKQFIPVNGKPVLCYTLDGFERHPDIDSVLAVCIDGWQDTLRKLCEEYHFTKVKRIITGGETGQESIRNGVYALENECAPDDIVVIHDGIRPLVDDSVLTDVIATAKRFGNGVTSMPYNEQIFVVNEADPTTTASYIPRETLRRVATPQAYSYGLLLPAYREAFAKEIGIYGSAYTNTMMVELGHTLHFAAGNDKNIKLTTKDDLEWFKAYLAAHEDRKDE